VLSMLQTLGHLSDELLVAGDNASVVLVKVRESELGLRLTSVQQLLMSRELQLGSSDARLLLSDVHRACSETERICEQVEMILGEAVLADDADESALTTRLDWSLTQLPGLPAVQLAYDLPLSATDLERLQLVSRRSHDLLCRMRDQCRAVHQRLLTRYDRARKSHEWLQFVTQVEHELSSPLAGNFDALLAQRKTFEASSLTL